MKHTRSFARPAAILVAFLAALFSARPAAAESLTLMWDYNVEPEVSGYIVYVGTQAGSYTQSYDVGNTNAFVFDGAAPGQRYYFAVAAYAGLLVSSLSSEVSGEVAAAAPSSTTTNSAPFLVSPGNQASLVGQPVLLQLAGGDPDQQPVTYMAAGLPAGLTIGSVSGLIAGTPITAGNYLVTATVSDGALTAQRQFSWTISQPNTTTSAPLPDTTISGTTQPDSTFSGGTTTSGTTTSGTTTSGGTTTSTTTTSARAIRRGATSGTYTGRAVTRPAAGSRTGTYTGTAALTTGDGEGSQPRSYTGTVTIAPVDAGSSQTTATRTYTGGTITRSLATGAGTYTGSAAMIQPDALQTSPTTSTTTMTQGTGITATTRALPTSTAPVVTIHTPADRESVASGSGIIFSADAHDAEDGDITGRIVWSSSIDGHLGVGGMINRTLSNGIHMVTASVTDRSGVMSSARITVIVGQ